MKQINLIALACCASALFFLPKISMAQSARQDIVYFPGYVPSVTYALKSKDKITVFKKPVAVFSRTALISGLLKKRRFFMKPVAVAVFPSRDAKNPHGGGKKLLRSIIVSISGFRENSAELSGYMKLKLQTLSRANVVSITGYTDKFGGRRYNDSLAVKRALAAEKYLGIKTEINGYGKCCYISKTNRRNRRIVIKIKN